MNAVIFKRLCSVTFLRRMAKYEMVNSTVQVPFRQALSRGQWVTMGGTVLDFGSKYNNSTTAGTAMVTAATMRNASLSLILN